MFQKNGILLDEAIGYPALDLDLMFWNEKYAVGSNLMVHYTYEDRMYCYEVSLKVLMKILFGLLYVYIVSQ